MQKKQRKIQVTSKYGFTEMLALYEDGIPVEQIAYLLGRTNFDVETGIKKEQALNELKKRFPKNEKVEITGEIVPMHAKAAVPKDKRLEHVGQTGTITGHSYNGFLLVSIDGEIYKCREQTIRRI